jgi:hypothetical protein
MAPTPPDLEERVRRLERFRYHALGRINALSTILMTLWVQHLESQPVDPHSQVNSLRKKWLAGVDDHQPVLKGAEPAHAQMVLEEYREALDHLSGLLLAHFPSPATKLRRRRRRIGPAAS